MAASDESTNIGTMLLFHNLISQYQLSEALEIQAKKPGKKLGEILTEMGAINRADIGTLLQAQKRWRTKGPQHKDVMAVLDWTTANTTKISDELQELCDEFMDGKDLPDETHK